MARGYARPWVLLGLLLLWQAGAWLGSGDALPLPAPMALARTAWRLLAGGELTAAVSATLLRTLAGFCLAGAVGLVAGFSSARVPPVGALLMPLAAALHAVPAVCWLPLALLRADWQEESLLLVTAAGVLPTVTLSTEEAVRRVPRAYLRAAATLGAQGWPLCWRVILPAALPSLLDGLRAAWVLGWSSVLAAELILSAPGLGSLLRVKEGAGPEAAVGLVAVMLLGLVADRLAFVRVRRLVRSRWGMETASDQVPVREK